MKFKHIIEAPEIYDGKFTYIITPYGEIKYRKKINVYILYISSQVKEFKKRQKMMQFIKAWELNRFIETHRAGIKILKEK